MNLNFNKNVLDRVNILKNEHETTTQFIYRAVENYVLQLEEIEKEKKNDRGRKY